MKTLTGKVISVHAGANDDLGKEQHASIQVELDGIEVSGAVTGGGEVSFVLYDAPKWRAHSTDF